MRHLVKGRKLGRTASHRKATLSALAIALIHERRITTTITKAKELRGFVEPLITRAKVDSTHNRRQVFSKLNDKYAVTELFEEVGPTAKDRPGGYTRVLKLGFRQGDAAEMAVIELVDYNDVPPELLEGRKKRTRRAGKSKKTTPAVPEAKTADKKKADSSQGEVKAEPQSETVEVVEDLTVGEVKEKLEDMDLEEAKAFVGDDERVTVQEALDKKIHDESDSASDFTVDEVKEKLEGLDVEEAKAFVGDDERLTAQEALDKKIHDESDSASDFTVDEVKEKLKDMDVEQAKTFVGDDERVTVQQALQKKIDDFESGEESPDTDK